MLLYTMNDNEIRNEILKEKSFLTEKLRYRGNKILNQVKRSKNDVFPLCVKTEIKTPNNNVGFLVFVATKTAYAVSVKATTYFIMRNAVGRYRLVEVILNESTPFISIYSAHFFERYVERLGLSVKGISAIEHFITHYYRGTNCQIEDNIYESYPFGMGLGVCNNNDLTFLYINTFIR